MQLDRATFDVELNGATYSVVWADGVVCVFDASGGERRIDNTDRRYKPCMTHCEDVIRSTLKRKPKSNQAAQRTAKDRPALRVVGNE